MMQSIKGALQPCAEGLQSSHHLNHLEWAAGNDSVLCIAVEYVKDKLKPSKQAANNMAQAPTVAVQQHQQQPQFESPLDLLAPQLDATQQYNTFCSVDNSLQQQPVTELLPNDFLQMVNNSDIQLTHSANDQDVDILITDQETGISYIVEHCLNDAQLMDADVLLDSDLLSLDESVLKSELSSNLGDLTLEGDKQKFVSEAEAEDLSVAVQQICDRPIQTRARASLPVSHLCFNQNQQGDEGVFAKKFIPGRTKFGPVEGLLTMDFVKSELDCVHLSIDVDGVLQRLDVSDENMSNWMGFVQLARKHAEQNLVVFQQDHHLYFLTTKNINAKQELLVGYSFNYAQRRNLPILEAEVDDDDLWPCYECPLKFPNSVEFQKHLDTHDNLTLSNAPRLSKCKQESQTQTTRQPLTEKKKDEYKCPKCNKCFSTSDRIQQHMLVHDDDAVKPLQCDKCDKRFLNNSALACHVRTHMFGAKVYECPMCKESFQHVLQLKGHVVQHAEDGKYTCPVCKKVFVKYSIIRKHIRAFHCDKVHACSECDKSFPTLDKLRMHTLKHSDHREFLCADCGKQFKRKDKFREHCKKAHSGDNTDKTERKVKTEPTDYHRFIYKCHECLLGFKRRGMLVNHLAKRHPDVSPDTVPELNLPIYRITKDYYCNYCDKIYKSSSKRKAHILKNHPGLALPLCHRRGGGGEGGGRQMELPNPTFSQTVGSFTTRPQPCSWCHRQYASKAKLLQHQRKKHAELMDLEKQIYVDKTHSASGFGVGDGNEYYQVISIAGSAQEETMSDERLYGLVNVDNGKDWYHHAEDKRRKLLANFSGRGGLYTVSKE